jgi:uroporphyrinogen decarboxylase
LNGGKSLQEEGAIQGNLDPLRLLAGGRALEDGVGRIVEAFAGGPHIFNLGHGILPETPLENVGAMIDRVRRVEF